MKIIQKGKVPSTTLHCTCGHCGTVFECDQSEAQYQSDQRDGDYWRIKCPLSGCGREVNVAATGQHRKHWPTYSLSAHA